MVKRARLVDFDLKSNEELKEFKELKECYNVIYKCNICRIIYGSDSKKDNGICPQCLKNIRKSNVELNVEVESN